MEQQKVTHDNVQQQAESLLKEIDPELADELKKELNQSEENKEQTQETETLNQEDQEKPKEEAEGEEEEEDKDEKNS